MGAGSAIISVPHEAGEVGRTGDEVGGGRGAAARQGGGGLGGVSVGIDAAEAAVVGIPRVADDGAEGDRGLCQPGDVARYGEVLSGAQGHFGYHELQVGSDAGVGAIPRGSGGVGDAHGAAGGDAGEVAGGVAAVIGPEEEGVRAVPIQVGRIRIGVVTACGHRRGSDFGGTPVHDLNQAAGDGIVLGLADGAGLHLVRSGHGDGDGACAVGVEGCGLVVAAARGQQQQREGAEQGEIPSQPTSVKLC